MGTHCMECEGSFHSSGEGYSMQYTPNYSAPILIGTKKANKKAAPKIRGGLCLVFIRQRKGSTE